MMERLDRLIEHPVELRYDVRTHRFPRQHGYHLSHLPHRDAAQKGLTNQFSDLRGPPLRPPDPARGKNDRCRARGMHKQIVPKGVR